MKVSNIGYEFLVINGLTKNPIELKKTDSVVFLNSELVLGHEQVFSTFDPTKLIFEKDIESEEKKAEKSVKSEKPEDSSESETTESPAEDKPVKTTHKKSEKVKEVE